MVIYFLGMGEQVKFIFKGLGFFVVGKNLGKNPDEGKAEIASRKDFRLAAVDEGKGLVRSLGRDGLKIVFIYFDFFIIKKDFIFFGETS